MKLFFYLFGLLALTTFFSTKSNLSQKWDKEERKDTIYLINVYTHDFYEGQVYTIGMPYRLLEYGSIDSTSLETSFYSLFNENVTIPQHVCHKIKKRKK